MVTSSDVNSMLAIYSHDTEKNYEHKLCTADALKKGNDIMDDFEKGSVAADSELTSDRPDIHYLSRLDMGLTDLSRADAARASSGG